MRDPACLAEAAKQRRQVENFFFEQSLSLVLLEQFLCDHIEGMARLPQPMHAENRRGIIGIADIVIGEPIKRLACAVLNIKIHGITPYKKTRVMGSWT